MTVHDLWSKVDEILSKPPEPVLDGQIPLDDEDHQLCEMCGDSVYCLSSRSWCDGCEEEFERVQSMTPEERAEEERLIAQCVSEGEIK